MRYLYSLVLWMIAVSTASCSDAPESPCSLQTNVNLVNDRVDVEVCVDSVRKTLVSIPGAATPVSVFSPESPIGSDLIAVAVLLDQDGSSRSVETTFYDRLTASALLSTRSSNIPSLSDYNADGIQELVFYGLSIDFRSHTLTDIGVPTIIELRSVPTLGLVGEYANLLSQLAESTAGYIETLTHACTFDGEFDPECAAASDVEKLKMLQLLLLGNLQ